MDSKPGANAFETRVNTLPVKATLLCLSTLTVMAGATIAPSLPAMQDYFKAVPNSDYAVRLALTLPALLIAVGAPVVGVAIDRLGRKTILLIALALYGIAGSSGFILGSLDMILIGRALLGISVAGIMTIATTLVGDYYSGGSRAQFLGLQSGFMGLGGVLFLSLGGVLADMNWRLPFLIYLLALILLPFVLIFLPEPPRSRSAPGTVSPPKAAIAAPAQSFPLNLVVLTYGIALITQIVFYLIPVQLPFYLKQIANASAGESGLAIALATLFSAISSILYRQVKTRFTFTQIYGMAFANIALGYGLIAWAGHYAIVLLGLAITGSGLGLLMPNMVLCLTTVAPEHLRGRVLSGITTSFFLGQFLSPLLSQPLSKAIGLGKTYGAAAFLMLCLTGCILLVQQRQKSQIRS
jgi:MFS family permease